MEKEIHDQPDACQHTLSAYIDPIAGRADAPDGFDFTRLDRLQIVACGTAFYAGLIGKYLIETPGRPAGRRRDRLGVPLPRPGAAPGTLALAISQSGETADTLAALRWCKEQGLTTAADRQRPRIRPWPARSTWCWPTNAGTGDRRRLHQGLHRPGRRADRPRHRRRPPARPHRRRAEEARLVAVLLEAPRLIAEAIAETEEQVRPIAQEIAKARDVLYLGRGPMFPLALEGALKLKEVSYIHAEGYAAGELKHGPDRPDRRGDAGDRHRPQRRLLREDPAPTCSEVIARDGPVVLITDEDGRRPRAAEGAAVIVAPACDPLIAPLVFAVPMQLLAYQVARSKGADVDQPRNLAKSVTVE